MAFDNLRRDISVSFLTDEEGLSAKLLARARFSASEKAATQALARELVNRIRAQAPLRGGIDALLQEYALSTQEGVVLMCLAESLLRVPDAETADRLIRDKLGHGKWDEHLGKSSSVFVNASTFALMLTGRVVRLDEASRWDFEGIWRKLVGRAGEPMIRQAMAYAMRVLGRQFVLGRTIEEALRNTQLGYRYSFDMLGEAAYTKADAAHYLAAYRDALQAIAKNADGASVFARPSISVKLSALHPRYEYANRERVLRELLPSLIALAEEAKAANLGLTIDAEEAERLDLMLDVFEAMSGGCELQGWNGLGLAVQAYQKRALPVLAWLSQLGRAQGRRIPVRLVKGAYWDTEIKRAQEGGLTDYPVFTRKVGTDVSYIACARAMLAAGEAIYPQFATHNAHSLAAVETLANGRTDLEFQRLHGMGDALYEVFHGLKQPGLCGIGMRIYAPVGNHEDLLAYLVRRLLENGANTSFVNRLADEKAPIDEIVADPAEVLAALQPRRNPRISLPTDMLPDRKNSSGFLWGDPAIAAPVLAEMHHSLTSPQGAASGDGAVAGPANGKAVLDPSDRRRKVGEVFEASPKTATEALDVAHRAYAEWDGLGGAARAVILERAAELYERDRAHLMALAVREAGKTLPAALGEVREAVDFLRYYASRARAGFQEPVNLPGPTGEDNQLSLHGRGVFACISPWNFPLAIFTGQVAGALASGNAVLAKPAEQTPLIAAAGVRLLYEAGVPRAVLHFLPGDGPAIGNALFGDARLAGVVFTGSTKAANAINRALAMRSGPIATLIAETGGQNAMIVDSTALPEQVARDVLSSAFDSAGQRCSALRVLFLQDDVAGRMLDLILGAMDELKIGDPMRLDTDIGPVIDEEARSSLEDHSVRMTREATLLRVLPLGAEHDHGVFFAPRVFEIGRMAQLTREVFGPVLHVVRYAADRLESVCEAINATGYGLTLGLHSRIDETADFVRARVRAGNFYVNRSQIGAMVGVQPFGGEGLSGTGPKAGGPHYLARFAVERTYSVNTAATGGNAALLASNA